MPAVEWMIVSASAALRRVALLLIAVCSTCPLSAEPHNKDYSPIR